MKIIICSFVLMFTCFAIAADPQGAQPTQAQPEWMKYTTPGEGQKALNDTVGKFNYTMRWWAAPDAKPEESKGTSTSKWILNGRFVQQEVKGKAMGQEFNGLGFTGYDNYKEEYQTTWMDSMSTSMMNMAGKMDPAKKSISMSGTMSDPMKGDKNAWARSETRVVSKNEHVFEMYSKDKNGKEFKTMEMVYTRAK
jgi:hypothetical protein